MVSLIEALNGPPNAPQITLTVQPSHVRITATGDSNNGSTTTAPANDHPADEVPNAVKAAQTLNGGVGVGMEKNSKNSPQDSDKEFRLTVIPSESQDNNSSKTTSPSLTRAPSNRKTSSNGKSQLAVGTNNNNSSMNSIPKSMSRDSMKVVNEKAGDNGKATTTTEEDDSDDEKLSPLLNNSKSLQQLNESVALKMDGVDENIDDGSEGESNNHNMHEVGSGEGFTQNLF